MPAAGGLGHIVGDVKIPESTKSSLSQRLSARARERWPGLSAVKVRFRSGFAYVDSEVGEEVTPLFRLRYVGSASRGGSRSTGPAMTITRTRSCHGSMGGSPEEALDCACGLYLGDPTAWVPGLG